MTLQSNSKPAEGSHPCIQHLETPTWNCCRFRERRKRLGENINGSREHMTMTPETLHHQLVKPQSKSKQRRILTAHNPFHQDLKGRNFYFLAAKLNHAKPPRTESTWSGPKLQSLLGRNPTFTSHYFKAQGQNHMVWSFIQPWSLKLGLLRNLHFVQEWTQQAHSLVFRESMN